MRARSCQTRLHVHEDDVDGLASLRGVVAVDQRAQRHVTVVRGDHLQAGRRLQQATAQPQVQTVVVCGRQEARGLSGVRDDVRIMSAQRAPTRSTRQRRCHACARRCN